METFSMHVLSLSLSPLQLFPQLSWRLGPVLGRQVDAGTSFPPSPGMLAGGNSIAWE